MKFSKRLFLIIIILLGVFEFVNSKCIWYGKCGKSTRVSDRYYYCKDDGEPRLQTDENFLKLFENLCPHIYNGQNDTRTCCDMEQLNLFNLDLAVPKQLMSRCPACLTNFIAFLCDFTCGPTQSDFMIINNFVPTPPDFRNLILTSSYKDIASDDIHKNKKQTFDVTEVTYFLTNNFTSGLFNSCKDVPYPASNQKILDIMCGSSEGGCTPSGFVEFVGNNPQAPFVINMNITDKEFDYNASIHIKPTNTLMHKCSLNINMTYYQAPACGCTDCFESCPKPVPHPPDKVCMLWNIECFSALNILLFSALSAIFLVFLSVSSGLKKKKFQFDQDQPISQGKKLKVFF